MEIESSLNSNINSDRVDNFFLPLKEKVAIICEILHILKYKSLERRALIWFMREKICEKVYIDKGDYFYQLNEKTTKNFMKQTPFGEKHLFLYSLFPYRREVFTVCHKCYNFIGVHIYLPTVIKDGEVLSKQNKTINKYNKQKFEKFKINQSITDDNKIINTLLQCLSHFELSDIVIWSIRENFYTIPQDDNGRSLYSGIQFTIPKEFVENDEYASGKKNIKNLNKQKFVTCEECGNFMHFK